MGVGIWNVNFDELTGGKPSSTNSGENLVGDKIPKGSNDVPDDSKNSGSKFNKTNSDTGNIDITRNGDYHGRQTNCLGNPYRTRNGTAVELYSGFLLGLTKPTFESAITPTEIDRGVEVFRQIKSGHIPRSSLICSPRCKEGSCHGDILFARA